MDEQPRSPGALTIGAFALAVTLGSGNFIAVRFSNRQLPPFWGAGLRFGLAALLFIAIALALRVVWPRGRQLALAAAYGALGFGAFYALMYWALVRVTAGTATVVMAIVPLMTLLLAVAQGYERLRPRAALGAVLALAGILWMTFGPGGAGVPTAALLAMIGASLCAAQSLIFGKRLAANHPAATNAVGMTVGAVLLLAISATLREAWTIPVGAEALWAVAYLVTFGSIGLFVLMLLVVRRWTASAGSYAFVLFPVVTLALGALLADEPVTGRAIVGAVLVMLGVWFGALSPGARASTAPARPPVVPEPVLGAAAPPD